MLLHSPRVSSCFHCLRRLVHAGLNGAAAIKDGSRNGQANMTLGKKEGGESGDSGDCGMRLLNLNQVGTRCSRERGGGGKAGAKPVGSEQTKLVVILSSARGHRDKATVHQELS